LRSLRRASQSGGVLGEGRRGYDVGLDQLELVTNFSAVSPALLEDRAERFVPGRSADSNGQGTPRNCQARPEHGGTASRGADLWCSPSEI
jgi:hypothetical protein